MDEKYYYFNNNEICPARARFSRELYLWVTPTNSIHIISTTFCSQCIGRINVIKWNSQGTREIILYLRTTRRRRYAESAETKLFRNSASGCGGITNPLAERTISIICTILILIIIIIVILSGCRQQVCGTKMFRVSAARAWNVEIFGRD